LQMQVVGASLTSVGSSFQSRYLNLHVVVIELFSAISAKVYPVFPFGTL